MYCKNLIFLTATSCLLITANAHAETNAQIGGGYHARYIEDASSDYSVDFGSPVFSVRLIPHENFAFATNYYYNGSGSYSQGSNSGPSVFETSGLELNFLLGTSFIDKGFYGYAGLGYFSEHWESTTSSSDYIATGLQAPIGLGYNFGDFGMEVQYAYRDPKAYQKDVFSADSDPSANTFQIKLFANL